MLLLAEIVFTMIFTPFIGEKNTALKMLGAGGVFVGALFIMYQGSFSFNMGVCFDCAEYAYVSTW